VPATEFVPATKFVPAAKFVMSRYSCVAFWRELWIVDCGLWIVDCGLWIVDHASVFLRERCNVQPTRKCVSGSLPRHVTPRGCTLAVVATCRKASPALCIEEVTLTLY
jgi:hypothetical protein